MKELKCPVCKKPYPRWKLIYPRWYEVCPNCESKLSLTTKTSLLIGLIMGLILAFFIIIFGKEEFFSMPFIIYCIVTVFLFGKILIMLFAEFEKLPDNPGLLPMPKSSKYALVFIILGVVVFIVLSIVLTAIFVYYR